MPGFALPGDQGLDKPKPDSNVGGGALEMGAVEGTEAGGAEVAAAPGTSLEGLHPGADPRHRPPAALAAGGGDAAAATGGGLCDDEEGDDDLEGAPLLQEGPRHSHAL